MIYNFSFDSKPRSIETLEIFDVLEIVIRDLKRYGVPDSEITALAAKYVIPLNKESKKLKEKYAKR